MNTTPHDFDGASDDELDGGLLADINVTPLVDVMLVLLIVFMVAAPLMVHGVPVELPTSGGASLGRPSKPLIVSLTRTGDIFVRDQRVAAPALAERLRAIRASEGDALTYVRADRGVPYGTVMDVVERVGEGGFSRVSLLTQPTLATGAP